MNFFVLFLSVIPHFAQNVERSVTTLAKDPHGDVDEPQFIDASKQVSKDVQSQIDLADNLNLSLDNSCYHAPPHPVMNCAHRY